MSTLIIRDLDDQLAAELKREAKKRDLSVNRFLRQIIEMALRGPQSSVANSAAEVDDCLRPRNNLAQFAGGWTQADEDEFLDATSDLRAIDPEMWK